MKSTSLTTVGLASVMGSFAAPMLSIPLLTFATVAFIAAESRARYEITHLKPIQTRRRAAWLQVLNHKTEYKIAALQAHAEKQIDWEVSRKGLNADIKGSVDQKYLQLFASGYQTKAAAPAPQVEAEQPSSSGIPTPGIPTPDPWEGGVDLPEGTLGQNNPDQDSGKDCPTLNLKAFEKTSLLIVYGCPGAGKTTLAKRIARLRAKAEHSITVLDPHGSPIRWQPWPVVGCGRNYDLISLCLDGFDQQVTQRYEDYSEGVEEFAPITLLCDEFTQWASEVENSAPFVISACSDIRKVNMHALLITHADTLDGLGNAKGMRAAIDRAAVKIEVEAEINRDTGEYHPTGFCWVQYPNSERERYKIPEIAGNEL